MKNRAVLYELIEGPVRFTAFMLVNQNVFEHLVYYYSFLVEC